jgi:hypothetical protein
MWETTEVSVDQVQYWDVFPKVIKVSQDSTDVIVPLSIRGSTVGEPVFESLQPWIAEVGSNGRVTLGRTAGSTMILVYDSEAKTSIRYVQVEVVPGTIEVS